MPAELASPGNPDSKSPSALLLQRKPEGGLSKGHHCGRPRRYGFISASEADHRLLGMAAVVSTVGLLLLALVYSGHAVTPELPVPTRVNGTSFLDHETPISGFFGQSFLRDNIPFIDIPDPLVQDVYYYRWTSLQRNLRYIKAGTGYMCTEFVQPVSYAEAFGSIDAAAGHQIDESRWLRDTAYGDDYIQLFTRGPGDPLQYTQWILDAMSRRAAVTGDRDFLSAQLDDMIRVWHLWDQVYDSAAGLYYYQPVWDAQELSLPGFIADPDDTNFTLRKDGPDTYRPNHNAYMVANARGIAQAAKLAHDGLIEMQFSKIADELESAMYTHMWAPEQQFFMDIIRPGNPNLTTLTGREQVGLFPYRFGIGLNRSYAQPALDSMFDPEGFLAPYGPTTLEIRNTFFTATLPTGYCCWWNGQSWPFSTAHTLKSLAAIYRAGTTNATAEQYYEYLSMYARTQQKDGSPYVAESHFPFEDSWSADGYNHSEDYDHSTNNDDIITGLFGVLPQQDDAIEISPIVPGNWTYFALENLAYHGHLLTILYDEDGSRYNAGQGLAVYVDGYMVHQGLEKAAKVPLPPPVLATEPLVNIAANPTGPGQYPMANATFTASGDYVFKAIDGVLFYDEIPDNRWTNTGSPNSNDTLTVIFARPHNISSVTLAMYSDVARGGSVDVPARVEVYGSSGLLATANEGNDGTFTANDVNDISFGRTVETTFLAVNLYPRATGRYVGVCELEVWTPPAPGPVYYAVDAYLTGAETRVVFDDAGAPSRATANGAVVGGVRADSNVAFSGIVPPAGGAPQTLTLSYYADAGAGNASAAAAAAAVAVLSVEVNQVPQTNITLRPSGGRYVEAAAEVTLAAGKNYVSLRGGSDSVDIRLETLTIK
ncbi:Six-hairpin glycosidase-like protein [Xylariaceae sp. FL0804]|nr:Six-hairpin glycosidase-like protein [Xylariaceae sp. FL0804]